jgi:putative heme-binding domain-containing protein
LVQALKDSAGERALAIYLDTLLDSDSLARQAARGALAALGDSICGEIRTLCDRNELAAELRQELKDIFSGQERFAFLREDPPARLEPSAYAQYAAKHRGDPQRGKQLFADTKGVGCIKCHAVGGGAAANIGPDLLGIGAKYPRRELIRAVLEPSNQILIDFEMAIVATTDGQIHQGMIRSQTPEGIDLVTPEGHAVSIPASVIEIQKTSNLSPMPSGLASGMSLANFADLIAYLESLKQAAVPVSQSRP